MDSDALLASSQDSISVPVSPRGAYGSVRTRSPSIYFSTAGTSIRESKVAKAAQAAFDDLALSLHAVEVAQSLPANEITPAVLCYMCFIDSRRRKPLTDLQQQVFATYVMKRYTTYAWLGIRRGIPAFFFPVVFPIMVTLATIYVDDIRESVVTAAIVSCVLSILEIIVGQLAGWIITGTQPNESSEAANEAQNVLFDLSEDMQAYAYYLLDLYGSEDPAMRTFARTVCETINIAAIENSMLAMVPRPDPTEAEDPLLSRARFHRILQPLREVATYIQSEGCTPPKDEGLRGRIEVANLREQMQTVVQKLDLLLKART